MKLKTISKTVTRTVSFKHIYEARYWPEKFQYPTNKEYERHLTIDIRSRLILAKDIIEARKIAEKLYMPDYKLGDCRMAVILK